MSEIEIRNPIQKRSIETKEKIINAGFDLICNNGYYNTNTSKIAKKAGVSTGIIYQYFKDKHDILMAGLDKYADSIFFPMINLLDIKFNKDDFSNIINKIIRQHISNHKLSKIAHEEIMAMIHSDKEIASYYYEREIDMTNKTAKMLEKNGFTISNINERAHLIIGIIDNLCHEIVYHKHNELDYNKMMDLAIESIIHLVE